jgi:hypothetical protein
MDEGGALGGPVRCMVWRQLDSGLPTRQFGILVCLEGDDTKAQNVLKPCDRLLEVAHAQFNPACFAQFLNAFHFHMKGTRRLLLKSLLRSLKTRIVEGLLQHIDYSQHGRRLTKIGDI